MQGEGERRREESESAQRGRKGGERCGHRLALPSRAEQVVEQQEAQGQAGGCSVRTPQEAQAVPKEG